MLLVLFKPPFLSLPGVNSWQRNFNYFLPLYLFVRATTAKHHELDILQYAFLSFWILGLQEWGIVRAGSSQGTEREFDPCLSPSFLNFNPWHSGTSRSVTSLNMVLSFGVFASKTRTLIILDGASSLLQYLLSFKKYLQLICSQIKQHSIILIIINSPCIF